MPPRGCSELEPCQTLSLHVLPWPDTSIGRPSPSVTPDPQHHLSPSKYPDLGLSLGCHIFVGPLLTIEKRLRSRPSLPGNFFLLSLTR